MKPVLSSAAIAALVFSGAVSAQGLTWFTGDTKLACEAILCLSASQGRSESACQPSLRRYFSINKRRLRDTIRARHDFLDLCPASSQTPEMKTLVAALAAGAGRCDAVSLNMTLVFLGVDPNTGAEITYVSNVMPDYCTVYYMHPNTAYPVDHLVPRYVGLPERGGLWAEPADYDRLLAEYSARVAAEEQDRLNNSWWWR